MEYKNKRRLILGIALLLLLLLYAFKNYGSMIRILDAIVALWVFYFFDHAFHMDFQFRHYGYILIIIILAILLSPLYFISPTFDKILHLFMPILGSVMIYYLIDTKTDLEFRWRLLITFLVMITLLALLEVGEYITDYFWDFKMQGVYLRDITGLEKYNLIMDKNDDTMTDLMLGFAGTIIFVVSKSIINLFNRKRKKKRR